MADIKNPSYYGPVSTGGTTGTALDDQTTGSLDCCVLQPVQYTMDQDSPTLKETWKCPTSKVTKLNSKGVFQVYDQTFALGYPRPDVSKDAHFVQRFNVPDPPLSTVWIIQSIDIDQLEAGDHSEMTVNCVPEVWTSTLSSGNLLLEGDHWDLEWRAYNQSVLAYCSNPLSADPEWVRYVPNANEDVLKPAGKTSDKATAQFIKECAGKSNSQTKWGNLNSYEWVRNCSVYQLNQHEQEIYAYYINNMNPTLHYPVLTHTSTSKFPRTETYWRQLNGKILHIPYVSTDDGKIGAKIDQVLKDDDVDGSTNAPNGCPYTFETEWEWLMTGDKMTEVNKEGNTVYQRVVEFTGALKWNGNFYENGTYFLPGIPKADQVKWTIAQR